MAHEGRILNLSAFTLFKETQGECDEIFMGTRRWKKRAD